MKRTSPNQIVNNRPEKRKMNPIDKKTTFTSFYFSVSWQSNKTREYPRTRYYRWSPPSLAMALYVPASLRQNDRLLLTSQDLRCKTAMALLSLAKGTDYGMIPPKYAAEILGASIRSGIEIFYADRSSMAKDALLRYRDIKVDENNMGEVVEIVNSAEIDNISFRPCTTFYETRPLIMALYSKDDSSSDDDTSLYSSDFTDSESSSEEEEVDPRVTAVLKIIADNFHQLSVDIHKAIVKK